MTKKVNVILPFPTKRPNGGPKVMFKYANLLDDKGYDVQIYHAINTSYMKYRKPYFLRVILHKLRKTHRPYWFELKPTVKSCNVKEISNSYIRDADFIISTWWATALEVDRLNASKGKKFNLIQDYENNLGREDLLIQSYSLKNTTNIAVSNFIYDIIKPHSVLKPELLLNAIETDKFYITTEIEERDPSILMMFSKSKRKGSKYGVEALSLIKRKYPKVKITLFSTDKRPRDLDEKIHYYREPENLNSLYNSHSIFITPSIKEGFGLPACEALACGCALVATDLEGHKDFAFNNQTALTIAPKDVNDIVDKLEMLLENDELRIKLAKAGHNYLMNNFSWTKNIDKLEFILNSA